MDLLSNGLYRIADAKSFLDRHGTWWASWPGDATMERTRPLGVFPHPNEDGPATALRVTLHEVTEDLRLTATMTEPLAAEHLAEHVRRFSRPDLCSHGLPVWHEHPRRSDGHGGRFACRMLNPKSDLVGVKVVDVQAMIQTFDALADALHHLTTQRRQKLPRRIAADLLTWPVLHEDFRRLVRGEIERDNGLPRARARQLVHLVPTAAMEAAGLRAEITWPSQRRPEMALHAMTGVGVYLTDVLRMLGLDADERSLICSVCHQPFMPKRAPRPGEGIYCRSGDCQRERARRRQARRRDSLRGQQGVSTYGEHR